MPTTSNARSHTLSASTIATVPYAFNAAGSQPRLLTRIRETATSNGEVLARAQSALEREFAQRCPRSVQLYARAMKVFPGGVTHDNRRVLGNSLYIAKASGARKTDADGNEYIDYWAGHGALILGHHCPEVLEAVHLAAQDMFHPGACHEREIIWGEMVRQMIPCAERVRFTASGSEATALAVRLARAATGKDLLVKFEGHFHGWLDHAVNGVDLPFDIPFSDGVPDGVGGHTLVLPPRDLNRVEDLLRARHGEIAAIILEPTGASGGSVPLRPEFLSGLRELTMKYHVALIFDEVITGFRLSPGGAKARFGVTPDLTCLAKILAGGLPGGAVCGTSAMFEKMEFSTDAKYDRANRVTQYGTFHGSPLSAGAGIATLQAVRRVEGAVCKKAETFTDNLRNPLNTLFRLQGTPWAAYGKGSVFHLLTSDRDTAVAIRDRRLDAAETDPRILKQKGPIDGRG